MVHRVTTVAFEGIEARAVDVQVQVAPGLPHFAMVGLPDKAVSEAKERVRAALVASGLALPARRITVNLAPADLPKEGSHYDLPIALGLMAEIGAIPSDALSGCTVLGELGLDGSIAPVAGVLPAAIGANARQEGLICPAACGPEAATAPRRSAACTWPRPCPTGRWPTRCVAPREGRGLGSRPSRHQAKNDITAILQTPAANGGTHRDW
jgi:magnesium chelatase family protein